MARSVGKDSGYRAGGNADGELLSSVFFRFARYFGTGGSGKCIARMAFEGDYLGARIFGFCFCTVVK